MARYYRRRGRRTYRRRGLKTQRYSVETSVCAGAFDLRQEQQGTQWKAFVPVSNVQGLRKVKNITLDFVMETAVHMTFGWALVYWPQFDKSHMLYEPTLAAPDSSMILSLYEPNQNVIMQGIFNTTDSKQFRRFSSLARNLNSEDTLMLLIRPYNWDESTVPEGSNQIRYAFTVKYAITF